MSAVVHPCGSYQLLSGKPLSAPSRRQPHAQAVLRPQHHFQLTLRRPLLELDMEPLENGGGDQNDLHRSEAVADANARSTAKGNVRVRRNLIDPAGLETVGIEAFRIREVARIALNDIGRDEQPAAAAHVVAA